ncbi:MAG TPA: transglutaminase-like domain-containing protein, partial [Candidatus Polarisedimenticolia bacterium]|nr:transglutaminase-like domain-containing protein [Candidatus Polarisedimenticolia bacterium]
MTTSEARSSFLELAARPDDEIDLAVAALLIAKEEYPEMVVAEYVSRLGGLADQLRPRLSGLQGNPFAMIDALNGYLFREVGFRGNQEEYFDARNSFLNDVLDRKRGIPITLSLVYMEVARRLEFPLEGVGFPGHFLVRHRDAGREILIDPFHAGEILLPDDCRRRLKAAHGADVPLTASFFHAVTRKQILARM